MQITHPTFLGRLRTAVQDQAEPPLRTATLYLLLQDQSLVRTVAEYARGTLTAEQLLNAVIQAMSLSPKKFPVSGTDITVLLQKHARDALPRN